MGRSRYVITEPDNPPFLTCMVLEWLPLFARPARVDILLDCRRYQQAHQGLRLYGYVVLENHLHFIAQASAASSPSRHARSSTNWKRAALSLCWNGCTLPNARTSSTAPTNSGRKAHMRNCCAARQ